MFLCVRACVYVVYVRSVFLRDNAGLYRLSVQLGNKASSLLAFPFTRLSVWGAEQATPGCKHSAKCTNKPSSWAYRLALCYEWTEPFIFNIVVNVTAKRDTVCVCVALLATLKLAAYHYSFMTCL